MAWRMLRRKDFRTGLVNLAFRKDHGGTKHFSSGTFGKLAQFFHSDGPNGAANCTTFKHYTVRLEGKVALVTGGAAGIGEAIVRLFRQHGAKVCIADVQDEAGQQVCDSLGGDPDVLFVHCDVTVEEDVSQAVDATAEKFGTLDIMVNNAGITGNKITDIRSVDFAEVRKVFDINVHGVFLGMKHAARIMIPNKKGSIISLASVASVIGGMGPHAYTATKHAVVGLTKNVAGELGKHGIRVNCVSPYAVPTGLHATFAPGPAQG